MGRKRSTEFIFSRLNFCKVFRKGLSSMKRNLDLKEIRKKKREIYKGLRILLSKGRKTGCELGNLNLSDISDKEMYYVKQLQKF